MKKISHATYETPDLERQIDYFTQVVGLAVAARENGRAHLATKVGDLVVQLDKGDQARCSKLAFQVDPDTEFGDIRKGLEAEGVRCESRNDTAPGIPKTVTFEDPKGTKIDVFAEQTPIAKNQPADSETKLAIFLGGRLMQFIPGDPQVCGGLAYQRFPEMESLGPAKT